MQYRGGDRTWRKRRFSARDHRPHQDLWMVVKLDTFIESVGCTTRAQVLAAVERFKGYPVDVIYLGQPEHISKPLASDGSWDGD